VGRWEDFVVTRRVWRAATGHDGFGDRLILCVGCLEARLGRELTPGDFEPGMPVNEPRPWDTVRLAARKSGLPVGALVGRWPPRGAAAL
jgi:hypothetical protein